MLRLKCESQAFKVSAFGSVTGSLEYSCSLSHVLLYLP